MIRILFVCHGNICRSPMAEFVMKNLVKTEKLPQNFSAEDFKIASAATSTEEIGNAVYPPAKRMLALHGIDCSGKTARQMTAKDYADYDYIIVMDKNNLRNLRWILPQTIYEREMQSEGKGKISLLLRCAGENRDVADPWYTGDFQATWDDVEEGCRALLHAITKNYTLK